MGLTKFLLALYLIGLTLTHVSLAENDQKDFIDGHNTVRVEVHVPPVKWNNTLATYAQNYANTRIAKCELDHSNGPYGECIANGYGELKAVDALKLWASEKPYYDHKSNTCVHDECRHYTQIVWRDTKYIGCARVKCHNGWMFVTCNYDPPGNYEGERPY